MYDSDFKISVWTNNPEYISFLFAPNWHWDERKAPAIKIDGADPEYKIGKQEGSQRGGRKAAAIKQARAKFGVKY